MDARKQTLFLSLALSFFSISPLLAQMKMKLQLLDDLKWGVFVTPDGAPIDSFTVTGSGQVTVVMPHS